MEPGAVTTARPSVTPLRPLELLIVQPSPFCNLDCSYCYLHDRSDRSRMSMPTLERLMQRVADAPHGLTGDVRQPLCIVWHAGEPLALPIDWYEEAFAVVARALAARPVRHHMQTNAVRIDAAWCDFFVRQAVQVGVSLDGPAELHDRWRRTRDGRGTHRQVMRGIQALKDAGLRFHVIAVLTRDALQMPDAIFDFFADLGAEQVGFNVEEIEAAHTRSSLEAEDAAGLCRHFWQRMVERVQAEPGRLRLRELDSVMEALRHPDFGQLDGNWQNRPGCLLNVGWQGDFCHGSPELLGCSHPRLGPVVVGNVWRDDPFRPQSLPRWQAFQDEINTGVQRCRQTCAHFDFCLGGAPANKLAEHGRLDVTETLACRLNQKVLIDVVLEDLERRLDAATPAENQTCSVSGAR